MRKTQCLLVAGLLCPAFSAFADTAEDAPSLVAAEVSELSASPSMAPSTSGNHANPYAYAVSGSWEDDVLTVNYTLNAPAKEVNVVFKIDDVEVERVALTGATSTESSAVTAGTHRRTIDTRVLGRGDYSWAVEVVPNNSTAVKAFVSKRISHPQGVDVVNDPNDPYFGYVLVTEGRIPTATHLSGGTSGNGMGIYVFDPQLNNVLAPNGKPGFNGGLTFSELVGNVAVTSGFRGMSPRKLRIAPDGRVFVTTQANEMSPLYIIPSVEALVRGDEWINAFPGLTWDATNYCYKIDGRFICGPNVGLALKGSGSDLRVAMLSGEGSTFFNAGATLTQTGAGQSHMYLYGFDADNHWDGNSPVPDEGTPERAISGKMLYTHMYANIEYDKLGGMWLCQSKPSSTSGLTNYHSFAHLNSEGLITKYGDQADCLGGGVRFSPDQSMLAFSSSTGTSDFSVYSVTYDNEGATYNGVKTSNHPVVTQLWSVTHGLGSKINDFAWDLADNIYAVDNNGEYFAGYALPTNKTVTTPAPADAGFTISHDAVRPLEYWTGSPVEDPEKRNSFAYDVRSEIDYENNEFVVSYSLNAPAKSVTVVLSNSNGYRYELKLEEALEPGLIDPDGYLSVGRHTFRLPTKGYAQGYYTWSVDVENFPYTGVYLTHKIEFYRPYGIDVVVNPDSPYFGRVMVCEGYTPDPSKRHANGNPYHGNNPNYKGYYGGGTSGLFMWNADFTPIVNPKTGNLAFTGGMNVDESAGAYRVGHDLTDGCVPLKVRMSDDASRIFVTTQSNVNCPVYELPGFEALDAGEDWTPFFEGHWDNDVPRTYRWKTPDAEIVCGVPVGFDIVGSGDNMKMLLTSAYDKLIKNGNFDPRNSMAGEFNVGSWATWDAAPTRAVSPLHGQYVSHYTGSNVAYDKRGGVWFNQGRAYQEGKDVANTIFSYFGPRGDEHYHQMCETVNGANQIFHAGGGLRLSPDLKRMAVSTGIGTKGKITVYNVNYDADNTPTITPQFDIDISPVMGKGVTDIAWDLADNLYVTSNYGEYAAIYSLPRSQSVTSTRAGSMFAITNSESGALTGVDAIPQDVVKGTTATVRGVKGGVEIDGFWRSAAVYDLTGRLATTATGAGTVAVNRRLSLSKGVYVVVVDDSRVKVAVR